jgi:hypothetical protein
MRLSWGGWAGKNDALGPSEDRCSNVRSRATWLALSIPEERTEDSDR